MDFPIHVSAPGKLFLIGEYAVLNGAPALLTAVDRRVQVSITRSPDARWHVSAVNLGLVDVTLERDGRLPTESDDATATGLKVFDAVRETMTAQLDAPLPALTVAIDSGEFARDGHKLGLGSSAAVAAALSHALAVAADLPLSRARLATLAIRAHQRAQNGAGSGGDVAAAVYGGVIRYTRDQAPISLIWPDTLAGMAVVTGTGASTSDMVARVNAYRSRDPDGHATDIARLTRLADTAQHALTETQRFLQLAQDYFDALSALDRHAQAGIVGARHHALNALAARHDAVFKTSGAGGGDVGLAFARCGADEQALRSALEHAGAHVLPLTFGAPGVRIESARPAMRAR